MTTGTFKLLLLAPPPFKPAKMKIGLSIALEPDQRNGAPTLAASFVRSVVTLPRAIEHCRDDAKPGKNTRIPRDLQRPPRSYRPPSDDYALRAVTSAGNMVWTAGLESETSIAVLAWLWSEVG